MFELLASEQLPIAIIGPQCSSSVIQWAPNSTHAEIPMITHGAAATPLNNATAFPYLVRTYPSAESETFALCRIMQSLQWRRIAIVGADDLYSLYSHLHSSARSRRSCGFCIKLVLLIGMRMSFKAAHWLLASMSHTKADGPPGRT